MYSKCRLPVCLFVIAMFLLFPIVCIFTSCADDLTPSNGIVNYEFMDYDDSLTVLDFEVLGTKSNEKRQLFVNYSSFSHSSGMRMEFYESGSLTLEVFQDSARISTLKVSNIADTSLLNVPGKPTRILITPDDFTGSGQLFVKKP